MSEKSSLLLQLVHILDCVSIFLLLFLEVIWYKVKAGAQLIPGRVAVE